MSGTAERLKVEDSINDDIETAKRIEYILNSVIMYSTQ